MARSFALFTPENKGILGSLDDQGVVTFAVEAGPGSSIRGTELFNRMMDAFGPDARAIECVWRKSWTGQPSANIDKENELTAAGMPIEDAMLQTWTVTRRQSEAFVGCDCSERQ